MISYTVMQWVCPSCGWFDEIIRRDGESMEKPYQWTLMRKPKCGCLKDLTPDIENSVTGVECPDGCIMTWSDRDVD